MEREVGNNSQFIKGKTIKKDIEAFLQSQK